MSPAVVLNVIWESVDRSYAVEVLLPDVAIFTGLSVHCLLMELYGEVFCLKQFYFKVFFYNSHMVPCLFISIFMEDCCIFAIYACKLIIYT